MWLIPYVTKCENILSGRVQLLLSFLDPSTEGTVQRTRWLMGKSNHKRRRRAQRELPRSMARFNVARKKQCSTQPTPHQISQRERSETTRKKSDKREGTPEWFYRQDMQTVLKCPVQQSKCSTQLSDTNNLNSISRG